MASRAVLMAFFMLCFNMGLGLMNTIDSQYALSVGRSLIGERVQPPTNYENARIAQDIPIQWNSTESVRSAGNQSLAYNAQSGSGYDANYLYMALNGINTIVNFLWSGLLGTPYFLSKYYGMPSMFIYPLNLFIGITYILGIYSLIRGGDA